MKARSEIERRMRKLHGRYLRAHLKKHFERRPSACAHNQEQLVQKLPYSSEELETELELAPRKVTTLLVIQEPAPVRICMLGSDDPRNWQGDICDTDEKACSCPYFKPRVTMEEATAAFEKLLQDDRYVLQHFPDLMSLQWVLGLRSRRAGFFEWLRTWKASRRLKELPPPEKEPEVPEDLWR